MKKLFKALVIIIRGIAVLAVFTGLILIAAQYFLGGAFLFVGGLALLGLYEEGWQG